MENNVQPIIPPEPMYNAPQENKNLGTILCIISIAVKCVLPFIASGIVSATASGDIGGISEAIAGFFYLLSGAGYIAGWVLVIVARVKCKDTFSKVLLIIYLVLLGLEILATIFVIVACVSCISGCQID